MTKVRQIFLLRHAKSSWAHAGVEDFERPLNERGIKAAAAMGHYMSRQGLLPDIVLCSPARRTRETLDGLKGGLGHVLAKVPVDFTDAIYEASFLDLLTALRGIDKEHKRVLMIGHCPGIAHLASILVDRQGDAKALAKLDDKFPTCALAVLNTGVKDWEELGQASCSLADFVRPTDLWD